MKKFYLIHVFLLVTLSVMAQKQQVDYADELKTCHYELSAGRFDGKYVSYYKNGIKRSEGAFENNLRAGTWRVWDANGKLRMERRYSDYSNFTRIVPPVSSELPVTLFNVPRFTIAYGNEGFIRYSYLREADVLWEKRLWRLVPPQENPLLFETKFWNILSEKISAGELRVYQDEEFWKVDSTAQPGGAAAVIAYKIKEDSFFDLDRLVTETRIIGFCPVIVRETKDTVDFGWIYFPQMRKFMAREKPGGKDLPAKIKTFDDLFFYRYFYGQIYKESNVYDRAIASYAKTEEKRIKESQRIEMEIIESEHTIWIDLTK